MITIDGAQGEGGGQIVRSSLALSMITGVPTTIQNIRAGRKKPGLMRQHLTAVKAAQQVCNADVSNAKIGAAEITFAPGSVQAGDYEFAISTAGSITLVLQTIMPALMIADGPSRIKLSGGTHNPMAPPYDFLARSFVPLLKKIGPQVQLSDCVPGFFPAGGGSFAVDIRPADQLNRLSVLNRGELKERRVRSLVANLPVKIGHRECNTIAGKLGWDKSCCEVVEVPDSPGPGNAVMVDLQYEHVTEVFTGFGERGKSAEVVAKEVARNVQKYMRTDAPVGEYLTDQLMLPLAISAHLKQGGGEFRSTGLSRHAKTHLDILNRFFDIQIETVRTDDSTIVRFE